MGTQRLDGAQSVEVEVEAEAEVTATARAAYAAGGPKAACAGYGSSISCAPHVLPYIICIYKRALKQGVNQVSA